MKGDEQMTHTPIPWWNESAVIHASNGKGGASHPANCTPADFEDGDWARAEADAEFICCAVNNHADLLAALEANTVYLEAVYDTLPSLGAARQGAALIKQARAAIKAAKGEAERNVK